MTMPIASECSISREQSLLVRVPELGTYAYYAQKDAFASIAAARAVKLPGPVIGTGQHVSTIRGLVVWFFGSALRVRFDHGP